jgi:hypothetical protein
MNVRTSVWLASVVHGAGAPARAEPGGEPPPGAVHTLSVQVGPVVYSAIGTAPIFAGPKLTLGYRRALAGPLWLDVALGLASGACLRDGDEAGCVLVPGAAFELLAGVRAETRLGAHSVAFGKLAPGLLALDPDARSGGVGLIVRAGGGLRRFVSANAAVGVDVTGAIVAGRFELDYGASPWTLMSVEAGLVLETRF